MRGEEMKRVNRLLNLIAIDCMQLLSEFFEELLEGTRILLLHRRTSICNCKLSIIES